MIIILERTGSGECSSVSWNTREERIPVMGSNDASFAALATMADKENGKIFRPKCQSAVMGVYISINTLKVKADKKEQPV